MYRVFTKSFLKLLSDVHIEQRLQVSEELLNRAVNDTDSSICFLNWQFRRTRSNLTPLKTCRQENALNILKGNIFKNKNNLKSISSTRRRLLWGRFIAMSCITTTSKSHVHSQNIQIIPRTRKNKFTIEKIVMEERETAEDITVETRLCQFWVCKSSVTRAERAAS